MLRRLYDWTMDLAARPYAMWALFAVAFVESSFFPIPPDVLIIPMVLAARQKWARIALVATAGSVLGAIFGAGILTLLPQVLTKFAEYEQLLLGLIMMLVMIFMRDGLLPSIMRLIRGKDE